MKKAEVKQEWPEKKVSMVAKVVVVLLLWLALTIGAMHIILNRNMISQGELSREVSETKQLAGLIFEFKHQYQLLQRALVAFQLQGNEDSLQQVSFVNRENQVLLRDMEAYQRGWHGFALLNQLDDELSEGNGLQKDLVRYLILQERGQVDAKLALWNEHTFRMDKVLGDLNAFNLLRLENATAKVFNYKFEYQQSWSQSAAVFFMLAMVVFFYVSYVFVSPLRGLVQKLSLVASKLQSGQHVLNNGASLRNAGDYLTALAHHIDDITVEESAGIAVAGGLAANENTFNDDTFNHSFDADDEQVMPITTFNCFSNGVLLFEVDGQILYGNESALERLGIHRLTDNNREVERYIPSLRRWLRTREQGNQCFETALLDSEGRAQAFSARVVPLRVKGQLGDCFVMVFDDLETVEHSIAGTNWAHCITQELQPSIDSIKEDLNLLMKGFAGGGLSKLEALVSDASSHADSTVDVIRQMDEVQRIESGEVTFEYGDYSLSTCIDGITDQCQTLCDEKGVQFNYCAPPSESWVKVDLVHIQDVLILLMKNAVANSNQQGRIEMKLQDMAQRAFLSVIDYGEPLLGDNVPGIFHVSKPLHARMDPHRDVVLARCKAIVERHGGKLGYNATPEGRNAIYFNLPISKTSSKFG
ncbi:MAG: hypothetical protein COB04_15490 [Gammaproteobacteria bacterium]|nr:MAG: hypothetical protein COB04_15490 [Gammaproteobacteria bacterium]